MKYMSKTKSMRRGIDVTLVIGIVLGLMVVGVAAYFIWKVLSKEKEMGEKNANKTFGYQENISNLIP